MKRILLFIATALWLAAPVPASAQTKAKLCFPTGTGQSCQDVTSTNPLPTSATVSLGSALNVTVVNTTASPAVVTCTNCATGSVTASSNVTISNVTANAYQLNSFTDGAISTMGLTTNNAVTDSTATGTLMSFTKGIASLLSTINTTASSAIPAGSNNIGTITPTNSGAASFTQSVTPTLTTSAYSAGNCVGGFTALTIANSNGQSGFVTNFRVTSLSASTASLNMYIFDSQPTTSTCTDKGTFSLSAADIDKLIAATQNGTLAASTGATTPTNISYDFNPPRPFIAGGSTGSGVKTIFFGLQAATAFTASSTTDFHVRGAAALN